jgi:hypothetical protein
MRYSRGRIVCAADSADIAAGEISERRRLRIAHLPLAMRPD